MDFKELWTAGGPIMYVLLLCSLAVMTLLVERFLVYREASAHIESFVQNLPSALAASKTEDWKEVPGRHRNGAALLVKAGISGLLEGGDASLSMDNAYGDIARSLRAHLGYLSMIVTLSPLVGLLGTISGMIRSFNVFSMEAGEPMAITGGIGEALVATAAGLCVAIFALVVHTFFSQKMDSILTDMEKAESLVLEECRKRGLS